MATLDFRKVMTPTIIVLALGYVVDAFDLLLFNMIRLPSLTELGYSGDALTKAGIYIINCQMVGVLLGGILFGILGDKIGRKNAVLGSIILYSIATLGCAFVQNADQFAFACFIKAIGLAGEIGLGVTLITEALPKDQRGLGVGIFTLGAFVGIFLASVLAGFIDWRMCHIIAGIAGLLILVVRSLVIESGLYEKIKNSTVERGNFLQLFRNPKSIIRYAACVFILFPYFFVTTILLTLSPEIAKAKGIAEPVMANVALMLGLGFGGIADIIGTILCQIRKNRKQVLGLFMVVNFIVALIYIFAPYTSITVFYGLCVLLGLSNFFVLMLMMTAEQFGTNLRATASTSSLSAGRATVILSNIIFVWLKPLGTVEAVGIMTVALFAIGFLCLSQLKESFSREMDFTE
ncbi:MAG: MFS transporter [Alphaproteobacteria bacterium]|nr:MFS transporter [Alphaproteobacteria bacterium]